jgi:hypothetical protein
LRNTNKVVIGGLEWKRALRRRRRRWEDDIRTDLREIDWEGVDWMQLIKVRDEWQAVVDRVMNLRVP